MGPSAGTCEEAAGAKLAWLEAGRQQFADGELARAELRRSEARCLKLHRGEPHLPARMQGSGRVKRAAA